jgi:hypothetical protein
MQQVIRHSLCVSVQYDLVGYARPAITPSWAGVQTGTPGSGTYSIWKATTYVEPAEWLYDVVVADGSVIRLRGVTRARQL